jgi:hypothetical protein
MEVEGGPNVHTRVRFSPSGVSDPNIDLGDVITAMAVVNAIPAVCDAAPGIKTYADLPLIAGRYVPPGAKRSSRAGGS